MKIAVLRETAHEERRVAASPETVKKMVAAGYTVTIEKKAGAGADTPDDLFKAAGAKIAASVAATLKDADVVLTVQGVPEKALSSVKKGAIVMGVLNPFEDDAAIKAYTKAGVSACAMELVPRISRAQSMDVLSSQSNLAGYKAVLEACASYGRAFPMMMTAAGTVAPAKVFVMGAGVAGLQAIATARRLGAVVSATDVRMAAKEQVQSLGASFVMVEDDETAAAETSGGYAKEMSAAYKKKQAKLIADTIAKQDVVITTALIPGRPAPELVSEAMVKSMKPGSVIVDMAAERGGNCALTEKGKAAEKYGVKILGYTDLVSRLAADTSALYAKNLLNFLMLIADKESKKAVLDFEDEIVAGVVVTHGGKVVHPVLAPKPKKKAPAKKATAKKTAAKEKTPVKVKAKKVPAKKVPAKKAAPKKTTTKKTTVKKTAEKK